MGERKQEKRKIELLAPAGNFAALKGAIAAGADAVYLGGQCFSARAYAENFTREEICEGLRMAHVFGKRVYLTVNTLVRESELDALFDFLSPLYQCGLDGVILQDLGALRLIRENFPGLSLHASTQMTLTGVEGVKLLQGAGISRVVPARELSLEELMEIKRQTGVELEVFVHGAMCYCYSGQCLFSSILGGRSGNRGRCAQPCRLPYRINGGREEYPLSMRDMCGLSLLPELICAGMDSLKIEGRMKKPAYAAGVTAIYRKYIDAYYDAPEQFQVREDDLAELKSLYIRSQLSEGYYHKHNGRDMLTLTSPAYSGTDEGQLAALEKKYIEAKPQKEALARISMQPHQPAELLLQVGDAVILETGEIVQRAVKHPLTKAQIAEQIEKSGNTLLRIRHTEVQMEEPIFLPVGAIKELRRRAVERMENLLLSRQGWNKERRDLPTEKLPCGKESVQAFPVDRKREPQFHVLVRDWEQFQAARDRGAVRIYLDASLVLEEQEEKLAARLEEADCECYLTSPYVVRGKNQDCLYRLESLLAMPAFRGILIRNLEAAAYFAACRKQMVLDSNLYFWNHFALDEIGALLHEHSGSLEFFLPAECHIREWKELADQGVRRGMTPSAQVYGRQPMMVTANCLSRTTGHCRKESGWSRLTDRYHKDFPVYADCRFCYNVIYNSVPLSLHQMIRGRELSAGNYRLDFTVETGRETEEVIRYFQKGCKEQPFYQEFTTGHYKRGAE